MLILGIDPGTGICGYGVVEMTGNRLKPLLWLGADGQGYATWLRLKKIYDDISEIIEHFHPGYGVEKLFSIATLLLLFL